MKHMELPEHLCRLCIVPVSPCIVLISPSIMPVSPCIAPVSGLSMHPIFENGPNYRISIRYLQNHRAMYIPTVPPPDVLFCVCDLTVITGGGTHTMFSGQGGHWSVLCSWLPVDKDIQPLRGLFNECQMEASRRDCRAPVVCSGGSGNKRSTSGCSAWALSGITDTCMFTTWQYRQACVLQRYAVKSM